MKVVATADGGRQESRSRRALSSLSSSLLLPRQLRIALRSVRVLLGPLKRGVHHERRRDYPVLVLAEERRLAEVLFRQSLDAVRDVIDVYRRRGDGGQVRPLLGSTS